MTTDLLPLQIIGIGASAGGLEALREFLQSVPLHTGFAFVIVQHRSADHSSLLIELLQRVTPLPVREVEHHTRVYANYVYVAPPAVVLSIFKGTFVLFRGESAPHQLPIDYFFQALAADQKKKSIAVVLSGMGSDGTRGIEAIRLQGGRSFAQSPETAEFRDMPSHAIASGFIDSVAPASEIFDRIREISIPSLPRWDPLLVDEIFEQLRILSGHDFSSYKRGTIYRRIERRLTAMNCTTLEAYLLLLKNDQEELKRLYQEMLIGVTSFFRDPAVWVQLQDHVVPQILDQYPEGGSIRAWVPGCSSGAEAFSLAMIFRAAIEERAAPFAIQIFASDLDDKALEKGRHSLFPKVELQHLPEGFEQRFFTAEGQYSRLNKEIREMVLFARHNILHDPPFTRLDLISCRNLLIYFDNELQKKVMQLLHYSLKSSGYLLLGSAETVGLRTDIFVPQSGVGRFYRKKSEQRALLHEFAHFQLPKEQAVDHPKNPRTPHDGPAGSFESIASQLLLQEYTPAAVLVAENGEILYISGRTGRYLEASAGKANWNLFAMARGGVNQALHEAFYRAIREKKSVVINDVKVGTENDIYLTDVSVRPIFEPEMLRGLLLVLFTDKGRLEPAEVREDGSAAEPPVDPQVASLLLRLQRAQEALGSTRQEMQTSQEELKSTNEELQASNEEMQSTNEELTTSREEIQSINEELQTVNAELQSKIDELSHTSNDMKNLLNSTDIATLFLDEDLNIRRFTERAKGIFKLIPTDAGRPITDLHSTLVYPGLVADTQEVLRTLVFVEKEVPTLSDRWFKVRIMPYRTTDNRIDGVVMTFINITVAKQLESDMRSVQGALSQAFPSPGIGVGIMAADNRWLYVNPLLCTLIGCAEDVLKATAPLSLLPSSERSGFEELVKKLMDGRETSVTQPWHFLNRKGQAVPLSIQADVVKSDAGEADCVLLLIQSLP